MEQERRNNESIAQEAHIISSSIIIIIGGGALIGLGWLTPFLHRRRPAEALISIMFTCCNVAAAAAAAGLSNKAKRG
jgi:hypothetical protein